MRIIEKRTDNKKINYHAYKTWFEFDLKDRPQQNPFRGLAEIR